MPVWDAASVPPQEQFGYWREVICEAFVPLTPRAPAGRPEFASRVEVRPLGALNCAVISSRPQHTAHGPAEVRRTGGAYFFVNLQLAGTCVVRQRGREDVVRPGQLAVVDTTEPYWFDFARDWRMVSFRVPHRQLGDRVPDPAHLVGAAIDARSGAGLVVAQLMHALWGLGDTADGGASHQESPHWEQSFAAATAAALSGARQRARQQALPGAVTDDAAHPVGLRRAIEQHVLANLQDRNLSVRAVAARFGVSPRTLHNAFAGAEESFGEMVRRARLRAIAELLVDPACAGSVAAVGAQFGFADPAAFGRAFRREFGATPGEVRRSGQLPGRG